MTITHKGGVISNSKVTLDGQFFDGTTFRDVTLSVRGEKPFGIVNCTFEGNIGIAMEGPAARTVEVLAALRETGFVQAIDDIIAVIRGEAPRPEAAAAREEMKK